MLTQKWDVRLSSNRHLGCADAAARPGTELFRLPGSENERMHAVCFFRSLLQTQQSDAATRDTLKKEWVWNFHCLPASSSTQKQTNAIIFGPSNVCWWPKSDSNDSSVISPKPHLHFEPVKTAIKSGGDEQGWEDERIGGWVMTEQTDEGCREAGLSWWDNERENR